MPKIAFNGLSLKVDKDERVMFANFDSSALAALAYHLDDKVVYAVLKNSPDKRYVYLNVPLDEFIDMAKADSVGAHFAKKFKTRGFQYFDEPNV